MLHDVGKLTPFECSPPFLVMTFESCKGAYGSVMYASQELGLGGKGIGFQMRAAALLSSQGVGAGSVPGFPLMEPLDDYR